VGEEVDHIGMKEANKLLLKPDFLICGEPTELKLAKRQKGILKLKLVSEGRACHSGYPEKGINALEPLLDVL
jgi:acetylornithine deacetylase